MTQFYVVRHGAAEAKVPAGDAARRLTPAGRDGFARLARELAGEASLARIVTSPVLRARQTADLLGLATGASVEDEPALAPGRSAGSAILALGARLGAGTALVGHNPEIAEAVALAAGAQREVPAGSIAAVDAGAQGYRLLWLRSP